MFPIKHFGIRVALSGLFFSLGVKVSAGWAAFSDADPAAAPTSIAGGGVLWLVVVICSGLYLLLRRH